MRLKFALILITTIGFSKIQSTLSFDDAIKFLSVEQTIGNQGFVARCGGTENARRAIMVTLFIDANSQNFDELSRIERESLRHLADLTGGATVIIPKGLAENEQAILRWVLFYYSMIKKNNPSQLREARLAPQIEPPEPTEFRLDCKIRGEVPYNAPKDLDTQRLTEWAKTKDLKFTAGVDELLIKLKTIRREITTIVWLKLFLDIPLSEEEARLLKQIEEDPAGINKENIDPRTRQATEGSGARALGVYRHRD